MAPLTEFATSANFLLVAAKYLVLSEHSSLAAALHARQIAETQGFNEAVVMVRTKKGWQVHKTKGP